MIKQSPAQARSYGLTLIELLVVVGIIGLLTAIALPSVQRAREAARQSHCLSNLRQLGLGTQNYVAVFGVMPPYSLVPDVMDPRRPEPSPRHYSVFTRLLEFCDEVPLYHSMNFDVALLDPWETPKSWTFQGMNANATAFLTTVDVYLCPSDGRSSSPGRVNYRANHGTERWWIPRDAPFTVHSFPCPVSSITDGLSQTAAFSEKLTGRPFDSSFDPRTDPLVGGLGFPHSIDESLGECAEYGSTKGFIPYSGLSWMIDGLLHTKYNHVITPNSIFSDCFLPGSRHPAGFAGPRSNHPGGVNVAFCDGSVRFIKNAIAPDVWRAVGTRAGGEIARLE